MIRTLQLTRTDKVLRRLPEFQLLCSHLNTATDEKERLYLLESLALLSNTVKCRLINGSMK